MAFVSGVRLLSWVQLFWEPRGCGPPGSSAHGISQARALEWATMSSSRSSPPRDRPASPALVGRFFFFNCWASRKVPKWHYICSYWKTKRIHHDLIIQEQYSMSRRNNGKQQAGRRRPFLKEDLHCFGMSSHYYFSSSKIRNKGKLRS